MKYLPNEKDLYLLPRDYLINVINIIEGDAFREWMTERIEKKNKEYLLTQKKFIDVDPEIARIFAAATHHPVSFFFN